ncbi:hypothetical protein [Desulfuromonas sp. AOP6]|uniref:hypothetical protein n=1 Tax=Desulfuromonas sp. AOP6 TaxID=1566351 RepID=UPI00127912C3|nr:hypothetical protein [Desulfuromonas sp. AOP6]BCA80937.1 hypothetical protein AOP6_2724 [Desulfuromonas sp. AOP6]
MRTRLDALLGKEVEVRAAGLTYRGVLVEVGEEILFLRGPLSFHQIAMDKVAEVKLLADKAAAARADTPTDI